MLNSLPKRGNRKVIGHFGVSSLKRVNTLFKTLDLGEVLPRSKTIKPMQRINMAHINQYNCGKKGQYPWDCLKPVNGAFPTNAPRFCAYCHTVVANYLPIQITNKRVSKHIGWDRADFLDFHSYLVGLEIIMMGNGREEDVLGIGTYQLTLRGGKLLLRNTLYAPKARYNLLLVTTLMKLGFSFT